MYIVPDSTRTYVRGTSYEYILHRVRTWVGALARATPRAARRACHARRPDTLTLPIFAQPVLKCHGTRPHPEGASTQHKWPIQQSIVLLRDRVFACHSPPTSVDEAIKKTLAQL